MEISVDADIIKIENLMRMAVPREIDLVNSQELHFEEFQREIIRQIAIDCQVPVHILKEIINLPDIHNV